MQNDYTPLRLHSLAPGSSYFQPRQELPARVGMEDPAILAMTDLRQVTAVTADPNASLTSAQQKMIEGEVKLLLVTNPQRGVIGLITATDIQGEKPLTFMQQVSVRYEDILVRDIMTPLDRLEVLNYADVLKARIGDIVLTLKHAGRQHALVVDVDLRGMRESVRGIFSATQLGRQLGVPIFTAEGTSSFAAMRAALAG